MKRHISMIAVVFCLLAGMVYGADAGAALPFDVTLGEQKAVAEKGASIATVAKPVAPDAALTVGVTAKKCTMIIINLFAADEKGNVKPGTPATIIMLKGVNKGALTDTTDKKPLSPGTYRMTVMACGKTAVVVLTVQNAK